MGNTENKGCDAQQQSIDTNSQDDHYRIVFSKLAQSENGIQKGDLLNLFAHINNLGEKLWKTYAKDGSTMSLDQFKLMVVHLENSHDRLTFFLNLFEGSYIHEKDFYEFLTWCCFYVDEKDQLCETIEGAFYSYLGSDKEEDLTKSDITSWMTRNVPDATDDLYSAVLMTLRGGYSVTMSPTPELSLQMKNSAILNLSTLWFLSSFLPSVFKKYRGPDGGPTVKFEVEKLGHLHKLYCSRLHGFSASRLREKAFDYPGPLLLLLKAKDHVYCVASDEGLKEDWNPYGGTNSRLIQLFPKFCKFVSGKNAPTGDASKSVGIIYANFTVKTGRRGILVGHSPIERPVLELDEGVTTMRVTGAEMKLEEMEVWAAGDPSLLTRMDDVKAWEQKEVQKHKNRKLKMDDWTDSPDRALLTMGGVNARNADLVGGMEPKEEQSTDVQVTQ